MISSFPWARYSKKLAAKIESPKNAGFFSKEDALERGMRLVTGREGDVRSGHLLLLHWLVDESDGVIADAKFQVFGSSALIGAAEVSCELVLRKNYDQTRRLTAALLDKQVRDRDESAAFPQELSAHLTLVLSAIEAAASQCMDIPIADLYLESPIEVASLEKGDYPGWKELSRDRKIAIIEEVIASEIRPYIELDAGGIEVVDLIDGRELVIAYQGSCTSCHSATGSTLNAIQQVLRSKVYVDLVVSPDLNLSQ
jgi:NifU-like protein